MIYVITEDSSSGYEFWKNLGVLFPKDFYQVISAKGIQNVLNELKILLNKSSKVKRDDVIFLAIDNVGGNSEAYTSVLEIIDYIDLKSLEFVDRGVRIYTSNYYCYEEVLLSFRPLMDLINNKVELYKFFLCIRCFIFNKEDYFYFLKNVPKVSHVLAGKLKDVDWFNREHVSAELLKFLTYGKNFYTSKNKLGTCLQTDCCSNTIANIRDSCSVFPKTFTLEDKYKAIIENSVLLFDFGRMLEEENIRVGLSSQEQEEESSNIPVNNPAKTTVKGFGSK